MNSTHNSSSSSSSFIQFSGLIWQGYVCLVICTLGVFTNAINVAIFFNSRLRDSRYRLMMFKSLSNLVYLFLTALTQLFTYCFNCSTSQLYFSVLFTIAISLYFLSCLAIFRILLEILIALNTLCTLSNRPWFVSISYKILASSAFLISLVYYANKPFGYYIASAPATVSYLNHTNTTGGVVYFRALTSFGFSSTYTALSMTQQFVRVFLIVVVLTTINVCNVLAFKRWFNRIAMLSPTKYNPHDFIGELSKFRLFIINHSNLNKSKPKNVALPPRKLKTKSKIISLKRFVIRREFNND